MVKCEKRENYHGDEMMFVVGVGRRACGRKCDVEVFGYAYCYALYGAVLDVVVLVDGLVDMVVNLWGSQGVLVVLCGKNVVGCCVM